MSLLKTLLLCIVMSIIVIEETVSMSTSSVYISEIENLDDLGTNNSGYVVPTSLQYILIGLLSFCICYFVVIFLCFVRESNHVNKILKKSLDESIKKLESLEIQTNPSFEPTINIKSSQLATIKEEIQEQDIKVIGLNDQITKKEYKTDSSTSSESDSECDENHDPDIDDYIAGDGHIKHESNKESNTTIDHLTIVINDMSTLTTVTSPHRIHISSGTQLSELPTIPSSSQQNLQNSSPVGTPLSEITESSYNDSGEGNNESSTDSSSSSSPAAS